MASSWLSYDESIVLYDYDVSYQKNYCFLYHAMAIVRKRLFVIFNLFLTVIGLLVLCNPIRKDTFLTIKSVAVTQLERIPFVVSSQLSYAWTCLPKCHITVSYPTIYHL